MTLRGHKGIYFDKDENAYKLWVVGLLLIVRDDHFENGLDFVGFIGLNWFLKRGLLRVDFDFAFRVEEMLEGKVSGKGESHYYANWEFSSFGLVYKKYDELN